MKKTEEDAIGHAPRDLMKTLGIEVTTSRKRDVEAFCIWCHYRPVMDHQKYPHARDQKYAADLYQYRSDVDGICNELERQYPKWMFWGQMTFVPDGYQRRVGMPENVLLDLDKEETKHNSHIAKPIRVETKITRSNESSSEEVITNTPKKRSRVKSTKNK